MRSPGDREQALVPALHGAGFSSKQPWDSDELDHEFGRPYKAVHARTAPPAGSCRVVVTRAALVATALALVVALMMALSGPGTRLEAVHRRTATAMRRMAGPLTLRAAASEGTSGTLVVSNATRALAKDPAVPSGFKFVYQSNPPAAKDTEWLCDLIDRGAPAHALVYWADAGPVLYAQGNTGFILDFRGGPLKFGLQRAIIVSASLCEAVDRARGSVAFTFAHQETGRNMHGALAAGSINCNSSEESDRVKTCNFTAEASLHHSPVVQPNPRPPTAPPPPPLPRGKRVPPSNPIPWYIPPVSDSCLEDLPLELGNVAPEQHIYNAALERHNGSLVLAFRLELKSRPKMGRRIAVVELDDNFVRRGPMTVIEPADVGRNVEELEDVRLIVHRGELYLQFVGSMRTFDKDGKPERNLEGRQWLGRLERTPQEGGFRFLEPRRLLPPVEQKSHHTIEKNWTPLIYSDSIHMMTSLNPVVVVKLPDADTWGDDIVTEFVSRDTEEVQWRYGSLRGGTNAVFDAEFGGYVSFFHSSVYHNMDGRPGCREHKRTYYMGCAVHAAAPPFGIQLMTMEPLVGPGTYSGAPDPQFGWRVVFPLGLVASPEAFTVTYGKNDNSTQLIRFDRPALAEALQPPLPAAWDGPLTTSC